MKFISTLNGKFILLLSVLIVVTLVAVKFYFIPKVDGFLEMSVEHDMKRNMEAFEKIIHTVVHAADKDEEVVRRALTSISENKEIPVVLLRSRAINNQFGDAAGTKQLNSSEENVFRHGEPLFQSNRDDFVYLYPLKAVEVCQGCHLNEQGDQPVPLGYVLGLAISSLPYQTLWDSKLFFFVKDLFMTNVLWIGLILVIIWFCVQWLIIHPLNSLVESVKKMNEQDDEYVEFEGDGKLYNEFETLELHIQELTRQQEEK